MSESVFNAPAPSIPEGCSELVYFEDLGNDFSKSAKRKPPGEEEAGSDAGSFQEANQPPPAPRAQCPVLSELDLRRSNGVFYSPQHSAYVANYTDPEYGLTSESFFSVRKQRAGAEGEEKGFGFHQQLQQKHAKNKRYDQFLSSLNASFHTSDYDKRKFTECVQESTFHRLGERMARSMSDFSFAPQSPTSAGSAGGRQCPKLEGFVGGFLEITYALQCELLVVGIKSHQHGRAGLIVVEHGDVLHGGCCGQLGLQFTDL